MTLKKWSMVGLVLLGPACAAPENDVGDGRTGKVQQAAGETVTTDKTTYTAGENVLVSFAGMPGNTLDWISLSIPGSDPTSSSSFVVWSYTSGQINGSRVFASPPAGSYVARAYADNGYTLLAESAQITINASTGPATIVTDKTTYQSSETAVVTFSNMAGYQNDWISIAPQGSAGNGFVRWAYTSGRASGSRSFSLAGLSGAYVARAHYNNSFDIAAESTVFNVGAPTNSAISTDKASYANGEDIVISFSEMAGNEYDWISVVPAGSPDDVYSWGEYTNGQIAGTVLIPGTLPPGSYVARSYFNDSYVKESESTAFTVQAGAFPVALSTDKASYNGLEAVTVTYSGMSGAGRVSAHATIADNRWFYASAATTGAAGSVQLLGVPNGPHEIRAFFGDDVLQGKTAGTITVSAGVAPSAATYTVGSPVIINFGGMQADVDGNWVGVFVPGAASNNWVQFQYNSQIQGSQTFNGLAAGTYVARVFFAGSFTQQAESTQFTVQ